VLWLLVQVLKLLDEISRSIARTPDVDKLQADVGKLRGDVVAGFNRVQDGMMQSRLEAQAGRWEARVFFAVSFLAALGAWLAGKPGAGRGAD
jgi:hypothetical protein